MTDPAPAPAPSGERDGRGRFLPGNGAARGHGGSAHRTRLARALRESFDENIVGGLIAQTVALACDTGVDPGTRLAATKLLLSYAIGRPREVDPDVVVDLPAPRTAADVADGVARVFDGLTVGDIDVGTAVRLVQTLTAAGDAVAWRALEARLDALGAPL